MVDMEGKDSPSIEAVVLRAQLYENRHKMDHEIALMQLPNSSLCPFAKGK
jgi:hypothetical protein